MVPTRVNNGKRYSSINNTDEVLTDQFGIVLRLVGYNIKFF